MKKVLLIATLLLFVGTLVAPAMQAVVGNNVVLTVDDENPKDKKQEKSADKTKTDTKKDVQKKDKKDCATKCSGDKKPGCCSGDKKPEKKK